MRIPVLVLPHEFRNDLSYPQGTLIVHPERGCISGLRVDVTVGDVVSKRHLSRVKVVDYKTKRTFREPFKEFKCTTVVNPRGSLSLSAIAMAMIGTTDLCVVGEEDMLTIAFLLSQWDTVMYGQPDVGVVIVKTSVHKVLKALKIFKPTVMKAQ
ncbi:MAG: DUF359 domain-containing protein [Desulfurococcaceae archaeon]